MTLTRKTRVQVPFDTKPEQSFADPNHMLFEPETLKGRLSMLARGAKQYFARLDNDTKTLRLSEKTSACDYEMRTGWFSEAIFKYFSN